MTHRTSENDHLHQPSNPASPVSQASPSKEITQLFKRLFTNALAKTPDEMSNSSRQTSSHSPSTPPSSSKPPESSPTPSTTAHSISPLDIQSFFPELGIHTIEQIQSLIITIVRHVEATIESTQPSQTFMMQLTKQNTPLSIHISQRNGAPTIQLTCQHDLHQLLSRYLPELKQHLKKKNIKFDHLSLDISDE